MTSEAGFFFSRKGKEVMHSLLPPFLRMSDNVPLSQYIRFIYVCTVFRAACLNLLSVFEPQTVTFVVYVLYPYTAVMDTLQYWI